MHIAVASGGFEHHAIFDLRKEIYIHLSSQGTFDGELRVMQTEKRSFEKRFPGRIRVIAEPDSQEEGRRILFRAWMMIRQEVMVNDSEDFVRQCWQGVRSTEASESDMSDMSDSGSEIPGISRMDSDMPDPKLMVEKQCIICQDQPCNVTLQPCGHEEYCSACISMWFQRGGSACPLCRSQVDYVEGPKQRN